MTEPAAPSAVSLCRDALDQVARAECWEMAAWLAEHPDGDIVKHAYAEAARRACELAHNSSADRSNPRDRERRPVLVLTRELRECLTKVILYLESSDPTASERLREELEVIARLVTIPPPMSAGAPHRRSIIAAAPREPEASHGTESAR